MVQLARRVEHLGPTAAFEVLARANELARQGKSIVHFEIGEPDFDTPVNITDSAVKALRGGNTKYVDGQGLLELRKVVAEHVARKRGIEVSPTEVVIGPGASPVIFFVILALIESGDEVIYPNPGFFTYEPVTILAGGTPVPIHLWEEKEFSIDVDEIKSKISPRTKLLILNSPNNPTGGMISANGLKELADLLSDRDIRVLSDEVYSEMVYDGEFHSISSFPGVKDRTIIVDGFSKTYAMTGWRLGYGVMDIELSYKVAALMIQCNSCVPPFVQMAGIEALKGPQGGVKERLEIFRRRRDLIVEGLNQIPGLNCLLPKGAFYVFPSHKGIKMPSKELALKLLNEAGVACLPGTAFGEFGEGYLRFTYSNSEDNIREALKRIGKFFCSKKA
ncbi:aspartate aminotransferase [candidate division WOR-3 bacterium JGI_Cruoil_03_44_89]|uniref:Aminotransferase n=1 Tax=candidate division WOR-3 bacterium JGI_Cruoil_03_44_89 TaxID=1973748 RepID=A0A235BRB7_UNCW3|nr:MAG: aspartate aminotransferase [candidate division WOR-3 bacterium JGI_Cruoil_03_44_89]